MSRAAKNFDIQDSLAVMAALQDLKTPDRIAAIMAASYIDRYLEMVIAAMLPGVNSELREKMFGGYGFLNTMAAKIDLTTALGVITQVDRKNIIALNRVRNRFAHELHIDNFYDEEVSNLCDSMNLHPTVESLTMLLKRDGVEPSIDQPRTRFICAAIGYCMHFNNWMAAFAHKGIRGGYPWPPSPPEISGEPH